MAGLPMRRTAWVTVSFGPHEKRRDLMPTHSLEKQLEIVEISPLGQSSTRVAAARPTRRLRAIVPREIAITSMTSHFLTLHAAPRPTAVGLQTSRVARGGGVP